VDESQDVAGANVSRPLDAEAARRRLPCREAAKRRGGRGPDRAARRCGLRAPRTLSPASPGADAEGSQGAGPSPRSGREHGCGSTPPRGAAPWRHAPNLGIRPTSLWTGCGRKEKGRPRTDALQRLPGTLAYACRFEPAYAASSYSSPVITGPESWPLASTSRSTNSMMAMGAASEARMPALMMRM
jgi:hypothetical protein